MDETVDEAALTIGDRVVTYGLSSAKFRDQRGLIVESELAIAADRAGVKFDDAALGTKAIKRTNLKREES